MIPSPGVLVVTTSQRGAVTYYNDELVDMIIGFVGHVGGEKFVYNATSNSNSNSHLHSPVIKARRTEVAGVAIHNITSRMYTIAMVIDRITKVPEKRSVAVPITITADAPSSDVAIGTAPVHSRTNVSSIVTYDTWYPLQNLTPKTCTSLWQALCRVAEIFAEHITTKGTALVMDSKLLPITTALLKRGIDITTHVHVIMPVPLDAAVAEEILRRGGVRLEEATDTPCLSSSSSSRVRIIMEPMSKATAVDSASGLAQYNEQCRTVWMSYNQTMSASDLQGCAQWSDINNLLDRGWVCQDTTIGLHLKYSEVGMLWEYSHVDWLVEGMRRVMNRYALDVRVLSVCNFTFRSAHVVLIMRVVSSPASSPPISASSSSSQTRGVHTLSHTGSLPLTWVEHHGNWISVGQRPRNTPSNSSQKYLLHISPWICTFLETLKSKNIFLHEPGFNHVLPQVVDWKNKQVTTEHQISCCASNDYVQLMDLLSRNSVGDTYFCCLEPPEVSQSLDVAVLLCDGGVRAWKTAWLHWFKKWCSVSTRGALVLHVAAPQGKGTQNHVDILLSELTRTSTAGARIFTLPTIIRHWERTSFAIVAVLFGSWDDGTIKKLCLMWNTIEEDDYQRRQQKKMKIPRVP